MREMCLGLELTIVANGVPRKVLMEKTDELLKAVEPGMISKLEQMQRDKFEERIGG